MIAQRVEALLFSLILSGAMSLLLSGVTTLRMAGMGPDLVGQWLAAWPVAWLLAFPAVLVLAPIARWLVRLVVRRDRPPCG